MEEGSGLRVGRFCNEYVLRCDTTKQKDGRMDGRTSRQVGVVVFLGRGAYVDADRISKRKTRRRSGLATLDPSILADQKT